MVVLVLLVLVVVVIGVVGGVGVVVVGIVVVVIVVDVVDVVVVGVFFGPNYLYKDKGSKLAYLFLCCTCLLCVIGCPLLHLLALSCYCTSALWKSFVECQFSPLGELPATGPCAWGCHLLAATPFPAASSALWVSFVGEQQYST